MNELSWLFCKRTIYKHIYYFWVIARCKLNKQMRGSIYLRWCAQPWLFLFHCANYSIGVTIFGFIDQCSTNIHYIDGYMVYILEATNVMKGRLKKSYHYLYFSFQLEDWADNSPPADLRQSWPKKHHTWQHKVKTEPMTPVPHQHIHTTCPKSITHEWTQFRWPKQWPALFGPSSIFFLFNLISFTSNSFFSFLSFANNVT